MSGRTNAREEGIRRILAATLGGRPADYRGQADGFAVGQAADSVSELRAAESTAIAERDLAQRKAKDLEKEVRRLEAELAGVRQDLDLERIVSRSFEKRIHELEGVVLDGEVGLGGIGAVLAWARSIRDGSRGDYGEPLSWAEQRRREIAARAKTVGSSNDRMATFDPSRPRWSR